MLQATWKLTTFANGLIGLLAARKVSSFTNVPDNIDTDRPPGYGYMKAQRLPGYEQTWGTIRACEE